MAQIYKVRDPDGNVREISGPDGASDEQVIAQAKVLFSKSSAQKEPAPREADTADKLMGHPATRFALGAASPFMGAFQLGANAGDYISEKLGNEPIVGKWINEKLDNIEAMKNRGMKARGEDGFDWYGLSGAVASPVSIATGGMTNAPSLAGRMVGGAKAGAINAALQPILGADDDFAKQKAWQASMGATLGGVIPPVLSAVSGAGKLIGKSAGTIRDTFRNFSPAGQQKLAVEHIKKIASEGGDEARQKVYSSLLEAKPGISGMPTSAEAVAEANIGAGERFGSPVVRLQHELSGLPETTTQLKSIEAAQELARKSSLGKIAEGITEDAATAARSKAADVNYSKAFEQSVKADDVLESLMQRPSMKSILPRARELAEEAGEQFKIGAKGLSTYPVKSLHYMKMAMDDLIKNPERFAIGKAEAGAISKTQGDFVKWIGSKSKDYDFARTEHKRLSEIVNRTQARDTLDKILTGPKGEERAGQFLQGVRDIPRVFKKATGSARYEKLDDVLLPDEVNTVKAIAKELERDTMTSRMASEVNIPGATSPVTGKMSQLPSPLYRPTMIANWILRQGGQEGNENVNKIAADILADPAKAASIIKQIPPSPQRQQFEKIMAEILDQSRIDLTNTATIGTGRYIGQGE